MLLRTYLSFAFSFPKTSAAAAGNEEKIEVVFVKHVASSKILYFV
jgi:hypothetical protein